MLALDEVGYFNYQKASCGDVKCILSISCLLKDWRDSVSVINRFVSIPKAKYQDALSRAVKLCVVLR